MITRKIHVDPVTPDTESVEIAASYLQKGELVVFPTETVYGLGADAFNIQAVKKLFMIKNRPFDNPLLLHVSSLQMAQSCISEDISRFSMLTDALWPGPVTLLFQKSSLVPAQVTAGLGTVGVRFPAHPVARTLVDLLNRPVAAPSANLSGKPSPTEEGHVIEDMNGLVPCMLLSGRTPLGLESTIIDLTQSPPVLLRPGPISPEHLERLLGEVVVPHSAESEEHPARAPGMKYRHYAPDVELVLVQGEVGSVMAESIRLIGEKKAVILCCKEHSGFFSSIAPVEVLGSLDEPFSIAMNLFSALRNLSRKDVDVAIVESFPERGIGLAIMNRLKKAASRIISC